MSILNPALLGVVAQKRPEFWCAPAERQALAESFQTSTTFDNFALRKVLHTVDVQDGFQTDMTFDGFVLTEVLKRTTNDDAFKANDMSFSDFKLVNILKTGTAEESLKVGDMEFTDFKLINIGFHAAITRDDNFQSAMTFDNFVLQEI